MNPFCFFLLFSLICFSCSNPVTDQERNSDPQDNCSELLTESAVTYKVAPSMPGWLIGSWKYTSERYIIIEKWTYENDSTYAGKSYLTTNGNTVVQEYITLELRNGILYYKPTPQLSNTDNITHTFRYTGIRQDSLIFEDPMNDFPQKIIYFRMSEDSICALLTGTTPEGPDTIIFRMSK